MSPQTDIIRDTYARLLNDEREAECALTKARNDLETAREDDVAVRARAALAGEAPPKRKEVTLRHTVENIEVALAGYDLAHSLLLDEAITAVGEGRRELDAHEQRFFRENILPSLTDEDRRKVWEQSGQVADPDLRPDDLIEFVTAAYDAVDARHRSDEDSRYMRGGYKRAIAAIQQAKAEHRRRGHEAGTFSISSYEDIVTPELQQFLSAAPGRGQMQNQTKAGQEIPWPGSLHDLRENTEPQSTPA